MKKTPQVVKNALVITRHPALIEYIKEIGLVDGTAEIVAHASPELVRDRDVIGVLPHSLSVLTNTFTEVPMVLPAELRGQELSIDDMHKYSGEPVTYIVSKAS